MGLLVFENFVVYYHGNYHFTEVLSVGCSRSSLGLFWHSVSVDFYSIRSTTSDRPSVNLRGSDAAFVSILGSRVRSKPSIVLGFEFESIFKGRTDIHKLIIFQRLDSSSLLFHPK